MRLVVTSVVVLAVAAGCGPAPPARTKPRAAARSAPAMEAPLAETARPQPDREVSARREEPKASPRPEPSGPPEPARPQWKVVGVHDGDTLRCLDGDNVQHKVRLHGIDAPEIGQAFGTKSREHLAALAMGRTTAIDHRGEDRYGRTLARLEVDGRDVNREMLAAGMAWHYVRYDDDPLLAEAEREARTAGRGLWADRDAMAPWDWRAGEREREEARRKKPRP